MASLLFLASTLSPGAIRVNRLFSDGMVLQTRSAYGARAFVYGTAEPSETVFIAGLPRRSAKGKPYPALVAPDGHWKVQLDPQGQGLTTYSMNITGSKSTNAISVVDIVYGDVFICAGQSNMVKTVSYVMNATAEIAAAVNYPNIRLFDVPSIENAATPQSFFNYTRGPRSRFLTWQTATPTTVPSFSAVCYLSARELQRMALGSKYPLGLISAAVGGTSIDRWRPKETSPAVSHHSNDLFNGMIAPASSFSLKAMLWYQGEADSHNRVPGPVDPPAPAGCNDYASRFQTLINGWRDEWGMGEISFVYAQLAPNPLENSSYTHKNQPAGGAVQGFPEMRLAQAAALPVSGGVVDTTGMAVTIDLGDVGNLFNGTGGNPSNGGIHPRRKSEVGRRMALQLMHVAYATQVLGKGPQKPYSGFADGPVLANAVALNTDAGDVWLAFSNAEGGLALHPTADCNVTVSSQGIPLAYPTGKCCSDDRVFEFRFEGEAQDALWHATGAITVEAATSSVAVKLAAGDVGKKVASIRYAYSYFPSCVLMNQNELPLAPFVANVTDAVVMKVAPTPAQDAHLDAGVALTPPMGFNSWNYYHCNVDERAIYQIADALISTGLAAKGYRYTNIDDCWQVARQPGTDIIVPDPARFPSGMKAIASKIHSKTFTDTASGKTKTMLFGIYTAAHGLTCQSRPGSYLNETIDAKTYCEFGIDYLKIDQCGGDSYEHHHLPKNTSWVLFKEGFANCLKETGRPIVESVESCSSVTGCGEWIANSANLWRTGSDLEATWSSVMMNVDATLPLYSLAGPGHWNDPDMLQVGNVGLTPTEQRSHMAMWCFLAAPLLIGTDIFEASANALKILGATELIAVDQDPLGYQGRVVLTIDECQVWEKKMADGSVAVLLLNRGDSVAAEIKFKWSDVGLPSGGEYVVRDLWAEVDLGSFTGSYTAKAVASHGTVALRLRK